MPQAYLGIDLHKASSTWVLLDPDRKVLKKPIVPCSPPFVKAAVRSLPIDPTLISAAVEPVCGWRWFAALLEEHGIDVHVGNPLKTRLIAESRLKHDALDARMLAELLRSGFLPESYRAPDDIRLIRELVRERTFLMFVRTSVKNRLHGVLRRLCPSTGEMN
jgi:transposase